MDTKKNESVTFKTFDEYRQFYAVRAEDKPSKESKYYRVGEGIAKMACESLANKT